MNSCLFTPNFKSLTVKNPLQFPPSHQTILLTYLMLSDQINHFYCDAWQFSVFISQRECFFFNQCFDKKYLLNKINIRFFKYHLKVQSPHSWNIQKSGWKSGSHLLFHSIPPSQHEPQKLFLVAPQTEQWLDMLGHPGKWNISKYLQLFMPCFSWIQREQSESPPLRTFCPRTAFLIAKLPVSHQKHCNGRIFLKQKYTAQLVLSALLARLWTHSTCARLQSAVA